MGQDFVRGGGTTSSAHDQRAAAARADAQRRRQHQDTLKKVAEANPERSRLHSLKMGGLSENASVVLKVEYADRSTRGYLACDLSMEEHDGKAEFVLVIVCPSCFYGYGGRKPLPMGECQITLRSWHRRFTLDQTLAENGGRAGALWIMPSGTKGEAPEAYTLAGSIHTHETQTCPVCAYRFEIGPERSSGDAAPCSGAIRPV